MGSALGCASQPSETPKKHGSSDHARSKAVTSAGHQDWRESQWRSDMASIWGKPIEQLPVHTDIPRLGTKVTILSNGENLTEAITSRNPKRPEQVKSLLMALANALGETDVAQKIESHFFDHINPDGEGDMSQQLLSFLHDHLSETSRTNAVLRCCHQKLIFPGFYAIKHHIYNTLPFKDQRGTWEVCVDIRANRPVVVRHSKRQQPISDTREPAHQTPEQEFTFQWELYIVLNDTFTALDRVGLKLLQVDVGTWVSSERADTIRNHLNTNFPKNEPHNELFDTVIDPQAKVVADEDSSSSSSSTGSEDSTSSSQGSTPAISGQTDQPVSVANHSKSESSSSSSSSSLESNP